jgi:hypothetical protein
MELVDFRNFAQGTREESVGWESRAEVGGKYHDMT